MKCRFDLTIAVAAVAFFATACSGSQATLPGRDDLLAQAGFVRKDADRPDRVAALRALPPRTVA
jgi:hypothetical protein